MKQYEIRKGPRIVIISTEENDSNPQFTARLYLNNGETASHLSWKGKTKQGAEQWAQRKLAN